MLRESYRRFECEHRRPRGSYRRTAFADYSSHGRYNELCSSEYNQREGSVTEGEWNLSEEFQANSVTKNDGKSCRDLDEWNRTRPKELVEWWTVMTDRATRALVWKRNGGIKTCCLWRTNVSLHRLFALAVETRLEQFDKVTVGLITKIIRGDHGIFTRRMNNVKESARWFGVNKDVGIEVPLLSR